MKSEEEVAEGGMQVRKDEENQQQTAGGHCRGLCLLMVAHLCALFCSAAFLDKAGVQTAEMITWTDKSTQVAPRTNELAIQMDAAPDCQCATLQMELPEDKQSHSPKIR